MNEHAQYVCEDDFWSYEVELEMQWKALSHQEQENILKYSKLLKRFSKDPSKVGIENKRWLLQNAGMRTELIPFELVQKNII